MKRSYKYIQEMEKELNAVEKQIRELEKQEEWSDADGQLHDELNDHKEWLEKQYWENA